MKRKEYKVVDGVEQKHCTRCEEWKSLDEFGNVKRTWDGLNCYCKQCNNERAKEVYGTVEGRFICYKASAKERNLSFNLSLNEFKTFSNMKCHYCGSETNVIGIDRINSSIGYVLPNCISCCATCNKMKMDMGYTTFLLHIEKIKNNLIKQLPPSEESTNQEKLNFLGNGAHFSEQMNKWSK